MSWVTWIEIEDESSSKEEVKKLYQQARNILTKKIPDTVRLTSLTPEVAGLLNELNQAIHRNAVGLTTREKEVSALLVSVYNGCVH
ncbi:MAG: hypothetical protein HQM13_19900 [SAR324 cluster bacterium]|nr:hypothetical protein [SAR324 cluster bacterium]